MNGWPFDRLRANGWFLNMIRQCAVHEANGFGNQDDNKGGEDGQKKDRIYAD